MKLALLLIPVLALTPFKKPKIAEFTGVVKAVAEDGKSYTFKAGRHTFELTPDTEPKVLQHKGVPLSEIQARATLHVLGRFIDKQPSPNGFGELPPTLTGILAIVAGDDFDPPLIIQSAFNASLNAAIESAPPISSKLIRRSTDGALVASIISVKVSSF